MAYLPERLCSYLPNFCKLCAHSSIVNLTGQQEAFKPPSSNIQLGDPRVKPYLTSYAQNYAAPLPEGAILRSPLRNNTLASASNLKEEYQFAMQRVGE